MKSTNHWINISIFHFPMQQICMNAVIKIGHAIHIKRVNDPIYYPNNFYLEISHFKKWNGPPAPILHIPVLIPNKIDISFEKSIYNNSFHSPRQWNGSIYMCCAVHHDVAYQRLRSDIMAIWTQIWVLH